MVERAIWETRLLFLCNNEIKTKKIKKDQNEI
ncbi:hypothetical protein AAULH_05586 [Lactobacillus helveticus MTCC 5463]|nr:hypothetical protein AAULH_05586 [Lactobacillus helveticus MTCC 5463]